MTILLKRLILYRIIDNYTSPIDITDDINWNVSKGLNIQNNLISISLKNVNGSQLDSSGNIRFEERDKIKVYLKYTDDNDDLTSEWDEGSLASPGVDDFAGIFFIAEWNAGHTDSMTQIKIQGVDQTYILFNKVFAKAFLLSESLSTPEVVQKVVRFASQSPNGEYLGSGSDAGVRYEIDAKLTSEGGYIQDTRVDSSVFPDTYMAKVWKPIYEWLRDLSSINKTNSQAEITANTLTQGRSMIFWVDEENRFHWVYPSDTVITTLVVGTDIIYSVNLTKRVFDTVNMVIFNAGTDMYGTGIWNYEVDTTSKIRTLKMRMVPMTDIAETLINRDYTSAFNPASTRDDGGKGAGYPIPQFIAAYGGGLSASAFVPTTSYPDAASITSDSTYNSALREAATREGKVRARNILSKLANPRWQGTVEVRGSFNYGVGDLIEFTDTSIGIQNQKLRIMQTQHNVSRNGWFTTLTLEEDEVES